MTKFKVAAIVPMYNASKYIFECLTSLMNQTRALDAIIICDDCSTDDSLNIVRQFKSNDKTKIIIEQLSRNKGNTFARNHIISKHGMPSYDYLLFFDADDVCYKRKVEKSLDVFNEFSEIGAVCTDYHVNERREYQEMFDFDIFAKKCTVNHNSMVNVKVLQQLGNNPYDERINVPSDYDMWLRLSEIAPIYHIPEALSLYRIHGENINTKVNPAEARRDFNLIRFKQQRRKGVHWKAEQSA